MSLPSIVSKLATFLGDTPCLNQEAHVVYLLVEIRKIIAQEDLSSDFPTIKFYADWAVHTQKNHITSCMKEMLVDFYYHAKQVIEDGLEPPGISPAIRFIYMASLKEEMIKFLEKWDTSAPFIRDEDTWTIFIATLVKVLEEQPIVSEKPIEGVVKSFVFKPSNDMCVIAEMSFAEPISGYRSYSIGNRY